MAGNQRTDRGFVLRSVDYGDRDLVVTLYGREVGKFSAIGKNARGSKRRFGGGLQPMRLLRLRWTERPRSDLERLDDIEVIEDFPAIQEAFDAITLGSYATDVVRAVTVEYQPEPAIFDLLEDFFGRLADTDTETAVLDVLLRHFQLRLFDHVGAAPEFERCLRCGTPRGTVDKIYALRSGEGILCPDCPRTGEAVGVVYPRTFDILEYWRAPQGEPPGAIEDETPLQQARRLVAAAERRILQGKELKSRAMLQTVLDDSEPT